MRPVELFLLTSVSWLLILERSLALEWSLRQSPQGSMSSSSAIFRRFLLVAALAVTSQAALTRDAHAGLVLTSLSDAAPAVDVPRELLPELDLSALGFGQVTQHPEASPYDGSPTGAGAPGASVTGSASAKALSSHCIELAIPPVSTRLLTSASLAAPPSPPCDLLRPPRALALV
jgi:hypothetical protein